MAEMSGGVAMQEVAPGVFLRLHDGLTNSGIIVGDDSVLVIDSLRVPSFARALIEDVRRVTNRPIRYLVNTHSHWDHSFGNQEFQESIIVGHVNCRREMQAYAEISRGKVRDANNEWSAEMDTVQICPPALTFDSLLELQFGERRIDLRYLGRAHTSSDIFVHLPDDGLVFTGDVAQNGGVPFMLDGYLADWLETDQRILDLSFDRFASGHGPIGMRTDMAAARDLIETLVAGVRRAVEDGRNEVDTRAIVRSELVSRFGEWRGFERISHGIGRAYRQISASFPTIPGGPPPPEPRAE